MWPSNGHDKLKDLSSGKSLTPSRPSYRGVVPFWEWLKHRQIEDNSVENSAGKTNDFLDGKSSSMVVLLLGHIVLVHLDTFRVKGDNSLVKLKGDGSTIRLASGIGCVDHPFKGNNVACFWEGV